MSFEQEITELYLNGHKKYLRNLSIDSVIFGFHENELKVLLLNAKYAGQWALPGGFILMEENMEDAAKRILKQRTGLDKIFLQQFQVFSSPGRSTKKANKKFLENAGGSAATSWMFERFVTVGYWALVDFTKVKPVADIFSDACQWFSIDDIPALILDHKEILQKGLENLRVQLNYHPIGYNLLPSKFTMPEIQKLYETILGYKLDRRNFQRKILATTILKKLNETKRGVAHKAPAFYQFDVKKYEKALKGGIGPQW